MGVKPYNVDTLPRVRSDEFVSVYSNHVEVTASRWDLSLSFYSLEGGLKRKHGKGREEPYGPYTCSCRRAS